MSGTNNNACGKPATITMCPDNPPGNANPPSTGTPGTAAAWPLMACNQAVYLTLHLGSTTSTLRNGWLVPQTQLGTTVSYDGTNTQDGPCPSYQCAPLPTTYQLKTTYNNQQTVVGLIYASTNGAQLIFTYTPIDSTWTINQIKTYVGLGTTNLNGGTPTFTYTVGSAYIDGPYTPRPYLSASSFAVTYNLLRGIGSSGGPVIPCNATYGIDFQAVMIKNNDQTTKYNAYLGNKQIKKCCFGAVLSCSTSTPCYPVIEFKDTLNWASVGAEVQTSRCCPLDQVLDVTLALLPESKNNMNSGLTVGNVGGTCINGPGGPGTPCTMAFTFLYEGAGYRNVVGYYFVNPDTTLDKTTCNSASVAGNDPGLCTIWPDTSMTNSQGCLTAGDTMMISIPAGKQLGWFVRANGAKWNTAYKVGDLSNRAIWYSVTNPPNGVTNSDGYDSLNQSVRTRHYGWLKIAGTVGNGLVVGLEDLANLGDHDFNDVVYGVKLNGNWSLPGLPSYDPCKGTLLQCKTFDPYAHASFIYTPGCVPYITLDPGVGSTTGKDPSNYYAIPDGWTIAPLNTLSVGAATTFTTNFWISRMLSSFSY